MKKIILKYCIVLSALWAFLIFILCAAPGQFIPSANWLELLSFDKFVHASLFFGLCTLLLIIAIKHQQNTTTILIYFLISILYGGLLEIMQAKCFSNRSADWLDFTANSFGCILSVLILKKIKQYVTS